MVKKTIASLLAISMLGASAAAFAAPPHGRGGPPNNGHGHAAYNNHDRGPARNDHRGYAYTGRPGGPIPHQDWHKGDRLPPQYRGYNYTVDDYRAHGLSAPPRGYHWVGVNGDYVLAAIATGVIASVLLSGH